MQKPGKSSQETVGAAQARPWFPSRVTQDGIFEAFCRCPGNPHYIGEVSCFLPTNTEAGRLGDQKVDDVDSASLTATPLEECHELLMPS